MRTTYLVYNGLKICAFNKDHESVSSNSLSYIKENT